MNKSCLITGGSGGVALALAAQLRAEGWRVARAGRSIERLAPDQGDELIEADVSTETGAAFAVNEAIARFGGVPAAVVNAAGGIVLASIARTTEAQYRACLSANLDTAFFVSKAYVSALQSAKQGGALLLFSSVAARVGVGNHVAIAMAKGGIEALVRSLAADHSGLGLRVNAIAPGLMETPLTSRMVNNETGQKAIAAQYPLGRYGQAEDAAALSAFLLGEHAGWISGQVIALDGAFTAVRPLVRPNA